MSIACEIHFDNNRNIVHTGKQFGITVRLKLTEETEIHDIFIQLCGEVYVHNLQVCNDYYTDNILNIKKYLVHGNDGEIQHMMPGTYDYSFQCTLPNNLPSFIKWTFSFGYAVTEYFARVTISRKSEEPQIFENKFEVLRSLDLNDFLTLQCPFTFQKEVTADLYKTFGYDWTRPLNNFYAGGPFNILARLDSGGYVPGQFINGECKIDNHDPHYAIQHFRVKFNQKVILSKSETETSTVYTIFEETTASGCQSGESTTFTFRFEVPETLPTDTENKFVKIEYEIRIIGWMGTRQRKHPIFTIPIIIGTKPIHNSRPTVTSILERGRISPSMSSLLTEPSNVHFAGASTAQLDDDTVSIRTYTSTPPPFPDDELDLPTYNEAMLSNLDGDFDINLERMQHSFEQLYKKQ